MVFICHYFLDSERKTFFFFQKEERELDKERVKINFDSICGILNLNSKYLI